MVAVGEQAIAPAGSPASGGRIGAAVRLVRFTRTGTIGAAIVLAFLLLAILAPVISPADPIFQNLPDRAKFISLQHPLGTDLLGRDMLSRILWGSRISLTLA